MRMREGNTENEKESFYQAIVVIACTTARLPVCRRREAEGEPEAREMKATMMAWYDNATR